MPGPLAKIQATVAELERQTDASVRALHTIHARTSNVMAATAAFSALFSEVALLAQRLAMPNARDTYADAANRSALLEELHLMIQQLEAHRQLYAAELALVVPRPPPPKRRWWRAFRLS